MTLDLFAAGLCGFMAFCLFTLYIVSSPGRRRWMTLPGYLRKGILSTAVLFVVRSVNYTQLAPDEVGRINPIGLLVMLTMAYTFGAVTWFLASNHLPAGMWDRLAWVKRQGKDDPSKIPVMMDPAEVVDRSRRQGWQDVAPGGSPHELNDPPRPLH